MRNLIFFYFCSLKSLSPVLLLGAKLDGCTREGLTIEADFSLTSERVIRALEHVIEWRGKPAQLRCDNGLEYNSAALATWASKHDIELKHIQPGKP
jgi:putative transposase